jgi:vacuolar-type H+-ATPase subunit H
MVEEAVLREQLEKSVCKAEEIAEKRAAKILEAAARRAENLGSLADEALQKIVMKYIGSILPGGRIDRPNVKD